MRFLLLLSLMVTAATAFAQVPVNNPAEAPVGQQVIETTFGPAEIVSDRVLSFLGTQMKLGEAPLVPGHLVIAASALATFVDGMALARYLSHAQAHAELGHAEMLARAARLKTLSPHIPDQYAGVDEEAMEAEAQKRGAELFQATGCATGSCESFDRALAQMKEAAATPRLVTLP